MSETYSPSGWVGTVLNRFTAAEAATGTFGTMDRNNITTIADKIRYLSDSNGLFNFPATQVADAGANVFDDYEEGTWTPTIVPGTSGTATYTRQVGLYTKKGREVTLYCDVVFDASVIVGTLSVGALPFTTNATSNALVSVHCGVFSGLSTSVVYVVGLLGPSSTSFLIKRTTAAATNINTSLLASDATSTTEFAFSFTYFV